MAILKESPLIQTPQARVRRNPLWSFKLPALLCAVIIYALFAGSPDYSLRRFANSQRPKPFDWNELNPTPHLAYTPCFSEYRCARLEVPLDWNETAPGIRATIAIIRLPAQVPVTDPRYGGPVLINPGGPGVSGVNEVLERGKFFQAVADLRARANSSLDGSSLGVDDNLKYFDLIGFDPRGVNNSTPLLNCFPDDMARQIWDAQASAEGIFGSSDQSFNFMWARARALGQACADNGTGIAQFMNTPTVVADMVAIIERHGEWRENEAKRLLAKSVSSEQKQTALDRTRWKRGEEQLQYWGFSYGTILGQTFATLQPSRALRLVLDGVVDIGDYYRGDWMKNLQVTDLLIEKFCEYCHQAGPLGCAFYSSSSAQDIKERLDNLLAAIKETPVFTSLPGTPDPEIFTYSDIMKEIRESFYEPIERFPSIAALLAALANPFSQGSEEVFAGYKSRADYRNYPQSIGDGGLAPAGIECSDAPDQTSATKSSTLAYAKNVSAQSKYMGASWASNRVTCTGWTARPKWEFDYRSAGGKTSHPMLFIGNTLDPVTPVANAHRMGAMWEGSGVVEVGGEGHCTYATRSACINGIIGQYFQTGEIPELGKVCEIDERPFGVLDLR